jgi:Cu2+-containing amine oxidase
VPQHPLEPLNEDEFWRNVDGVCPNFTVDEYHEIDQAMRAHPDVGMRRLLVSCHATVGNYEYLV